MKHSTTDDLELARAAATFAALGSEQRLAVLRVLVRAGPEGLAIGELGARSGVTGSTLTHHLKILSASGLLHQMRDGRRIICIGADYRQMKDISEFLLKECCADTSSPEGPHSHE